MAQHQAVRNPMDNPMYKFNGTGPPPTAVPQHLSYYMNPDVILPRPAPRRTKRNVPDNQKDSHYWEKRKRNNEAARRSRENKRRLDLDIRQRVILIEEENNILYKELMVIKGKYGLSPDKRYLSTDENGELVGEVIEDDEYVHHKSGYSAIEEANKEPSEDSETNYPASTSGSGSPSPTTSTLDFNDDYMPMKKRRRPKMDSENEEHSSTSTTASVTSPTTFPQSTNSWAHSTNGPAFYPNSQHFMQSYSDLRNSGSKSPGKDHPTYSSQSSEATSTSSHSSLQNSVFMPYTSQAPGTLPSLMSIAADLAFHRRLSAESSKEVIKDYPSQVTTLHMQHSGNRYHSQRLQEEQFENRSQSTNSFVSRSEKYQDQARLENDELRQRLEQLSSEVAKMKNFVMKDDLRSDGEGQKDSDSGEN